MLSQHDNVIIAITEAAMPCGDNRILTAFFDYLADRAETLRDTDGADMRDSGDDGLVQALLESRTVMDVLNEIAVRLEVDSSPLRSFLPGTMPSRLAATGS